MLRLCSLLLILAAVTSSCHKFAAASDTCDNESTSTSTCEPSEIYVGDDNMSSTWEFMSAFSKLGTSWSHVVGECECVNNLCRRCSNVFLLFVLSHSISNSYPDISVVQGADGKEMKGDEYATEIDEALKMLQLMLKESAATSDEDWTFSTSPLNSFGKTIDDILLAFLR